MCLYVFCRIGQSLLADPYKPKHVNLHFLLPAVVQQYYTLGTSRKIAPTKA